MKKRQRLDVSKELEISKDVFNIFLRWLLRYETYQRYQIAKKLIGVCVGLRYYNVLRSIVAIGGRYDPFLACARVNGGYPSIPVSYLEIAPSWEMIRLSLTHYKLMQPLRTVNFTDFPRLVIGNYAFNNVTELSSGKRIIYAYIAPDFGLMCQFVFGMIVDHRRNGKLVDGFLCLPSWNTPNNYGIYCEMAKLETFLSRKMLSSLRKMGTMAPQEFGATAGRFSYTAYAYFCELCDTSGRRDKATPLQRVGKFLEDWYPVMLRENVCHFNISFLTPEELEIQREDEKQDTIMKYFMIKG